MVQSGIPVQIIWIRSGGPKFQTEPSWSGFWSGHPCWMMARAVRRTLMSQFPMKCSSKSIFDSCVNITDDEQGAGSVEIVLENGVDTSIRTCPFPYRLLSKTEWSSSVRDPGTHHSDPDCPGMIVGYYK